MITFLVSITLLVLGYFTYGKFIEKHVAVVDSRAVTPAVSKADGIDYKEIQPWRLYVIQFLNIAGLGPIFGAILGAAYGPMAYLWIVLGCIFMGAFHDFMSGVISTRYNGRSIPVIVGIFMGKWMRRLFNIFMTVMLIAVGCSFVTGPADLLHSMTSLPRIMWIVVIFAYYLVATVVPIDKIIGKIYPYMGALLLLMAVMVGGALIVKGAGGSLHLTELSLDSFRNYHSNPEKNILIPMMFVVISCGAISGFHSTQCTISSRCIGNEKYCRPVYYGAMISEGIVALIWATAAIAYTGGPDGLNAAAAAGKTPAILVNAICNDWLGKVGAIIAVMGVICCPITTGDTSFRGVRLALADVLNINQKPVLNRILTALPIFAVAVLLCTLDFATLWNYVGISNQFFSVVMLWTIAKYLSLRGKSHLYASIPGTFMLFIVISFFMVAPAKMGGLSLDRNISYIVAGIITLASVLSFNRYMYKRGRFVKERRVLK